MTEREAFYIIGNIPVPTDDENYDICQYQEAKAIALEAIQKQIAKKPIVHQCTTCGSAVLQFEGNYCSQCGQKLDWSDEK